MFARKTSAAPFARGHWLLAIVAILATVAQLAVAFAPLGERFGGMAPHVENAGATGHYTHDETRCPSCQARSIHGNVQREPATIVVESTVVSTGERRCARAISADLNPHVNPRAPPAVI